MPDIQESHKSIAIGVIIGVVIMAIVVTMFGWFDKCTGMGFDGSKWSACFSARAKPAAAGGAFTASPGNDCPEFNNWPPGDGVDHTDAETMRGFTKGVFPAIHAAIADKAAIKAQMDSSAPSVFIAFAPVICGHCFQQRCQIENIVKTFKEKYGVQASIVFDPGNNGVYQADKSLIDHLPQVLLWNDGKPVPGGPEGKPLGYMIGTDDNSMEQLYSKMAELLANGGKGGSDERHPEGGFVEVLNKGGGGFRATPAPASAPAPAAATSLAAEVTPVSDVPPADDASPSATEAPAAPAEKQPDTVAPTLRPVGSGNGRNGVVKAL